MWRKLLRKRCSCLDLIRLRRFPEQQQEQQRSYRLSHLYCYVKHKSPSEPPQHWAVTGKRESKLTSHYFLPQSVLQHQMLLSYTLSWFINARRNTVKFPNSLSCFLSCRMNYYLKVQPFPCLLHISGGGISSGIFQGTHAISSSTPFNPAQQVSNVNSPEESPHKATVIVEEKKQKRSW